jgi:hypothetical protein
MIKLKNQYDLQKIVMEIYDLVEDYGWWENSQISLQSPTGEMHHGIGKIEWAQGYTEKDFTKLNIPEHWEIDRFVRENNLYRTRIMKLNPKQCYSWHIDRSERIHLAIETHPHCFFIEDGQMLHIPSDGYAYQLDTTRHHTAMNCTLDVERIHIVGCL